MPRYEFQGKCPEVGAESFVHPEAVLIGDVVVGHGCYIGACAVLRGDSGRVVIGDGSSFQDNAVAHGTVTIGENTLVTHSCVIHVASIGGNTLVGIGTVVMDGSEVGDGCIVGAGSLLLPNTKVPAGKLVVGSPAKVIRDLTPANVEEVRISVEAYHELARLSLSGLREIREDRVEVRR